MAIDPFQTLIGMSRDDEALREALKAAVSPEDFVRVAAEHGVEVSLEELVADDELSDAELESVAGGYTFPQTDWIYCANPWTNVYCTAKC
jgi:predicted ribosomally synthesized peptide with nif11-like leader